MLLQKREKAMLVCVCGIIVLLGIMRVLLPMKNQDISITEQYKKQVHIEGVIKGDIEDKNTKSRYTVVIHKINNEVVEEKKILVYEPYPSRCVSGEEVSFEAKLSEAEDFMTNAGRVFAYKRYLQQMGISAISYIQESGCVGQRKQYAIFERMRTHFVKAMHTFLPTKEATLLGGLLLGLRGTLPADLMEAFRATGLIHIIVLSGHNITLIAEGVRKILRKTPTTVSFTVSLAVIVLFVLFAGAQMAAIRAGSMAVIALVARATHREYDGIRALTFVALAMMVYNPAQVLFSTAFHLSFLATLGLLLFSESIEKKMKKIPQKYEMRSIVAATLATHILLFPYLAYAIGEISVVGIPANILVLPIIPVAMLFGAATTLIATIAPPVATIVSPIAYLPLKLITAITEILARVPHATLPLPEIGVFVTLIVTATLIYIGYQQSQGKKEERENEN